MVSPSPSSPGSRSGASRSPHIERRNLRRELLEHHAIERPCQPTRDNRSRGLVARGIRLTGDDESGGERVRAGSQYRGRRLPGERHHRGADRRQRDCSANARQYTRAAPGIDVRTVGNVIARMSRMTTRTQACSSTRGRGQSGRSTTWPYGNGDHGIDDYRPRAAHHRQQRLPTT